MTHTEMARTLWNMYEDALAWQTSMGIRRRIPEFVRFYEGDQWPEPTKNTKNLPRPVINIVKMICRLKKSAILSSPVKIIYKCADKSVDIKRLNSFSSSVLKELDQDYIDRCAIDDAVKKGSYFYHYFWDPKKKRKGNTYEGGLGCELIDPLSIFFQNPCELDEQKQKWIIIASRERVSDAVAMADEGISKSLIRADGDADAMKQGSSLCTVLTVYYREMGEVYCVKSVRDTIIKLPFPIAPKRNALREAMGMENGDCDCIAELYPIVCGYYEKKDKCIYGLSEVEGLIPNQKAINFNIAMSLLNAQEVAWGKYIALPGALKGQVISNSPGQVLIDHTGTGNGIRKMQESYMQSFPVELVRTVTDLTRSVTGTSEFMTGEVAGSGMSGTAIARLQSQAQLPIEELRSVFMGVKRKQGRVLAQFFRLFYPMHHFMHEEDDGTYSKMEFSSDDYRDAELSVSVETVLGVNASAAGDINLLDTVLKAGLISLETYIKAYPDSAITDKDRLLARIEEEKRAPMSQMARELEDARASLKEAREKLASQEDAASRIVSLINENKSLKELITKEYSNGR